MVCSGALGIPAFLKISTSLYSIKLKIEPVIAFDKKSPSDYAISFVMRLVCNLHNRSRSLLVIFLYFIVISMKLRNEG